MESGIHFSATGLYVAHSGTFGGSHPTDVFGESIQEENNQELPPVDAPPTSGIRG